MSATSTLTGQALQASRAALSAALADQTISTNDEELLEAGEIQEVDMQAQAEGIKTVFSDPANFNVKVCRGHSSCALISLKVGSIPSTLPGRSGSIRLRQKVATCHRHLCRHSRRPRSLRHLVLQRHKGGWRTSNGSSALIAWRNFGGMCCYDG
jgi:hypothetical protein